VKLYNFSTYARKRDAEQSADRTQVLRQEVNTPGVVIELKAHVQNWFTLHQAAVMEKYKAS
jgi:hypothetical protein